MNHLGFTASLLLVCVLAACGPTSDTSQSDVEMVTATVEDTAPEEPAPTEEIEQDTSDDQSQEDDLITTPNGLQYIELQKGEGPAPQAGETVSVHYWNTASCSTPQASRRYR